MNWLKQNWFKVIVALALIVASGSLFYYFVYFLPQQNLNSQEDINAIRSVIAPTEEQMQAQREASRRASEEMDRAMDQYYQCLADKREKQESYIAQKCKDTNDFLCRFTTSYPEELNNPDCKNPILD